MSASVLKQDPNTEKVQKNAIYWDKTKPANFRGNPLCQATKRHLTAKRSKTVRKQFSQTQISGLAFQFIFRRF